MSRTQAERRYSVADPGWRPCFLHFIPGRARHIHVKVQAPGDARDGLWHPELVVAMAQRADGKTAVFQFIVDAWK